MASHIFALFPLLLPRWFALQQDPAWKKPKTKHGMIEFLVTEMRRWQQRIMAGCPEACWVTDWRSLSTVYLWILVFCACGGVALVLLLTQGLSWIMESFYTGMYTLREFPPSYQVFWHCVVTMNFVFILNLFDSCCKKFHWTVPVVVVVTAAIRHLHPVHVLSPSSARQPWSTALRWFEKLPCASSYPCTANMELQSSPTSPPKTQQRGRTSSTKPSLTSLQR